ncbi:hypothetical protein BDW62DRAFT_201949 [Aspergillus aurantiobrunneus]
MAEFLVVFIMLCLKRLRGLWYPVRRPDIIENAYSAVGTHFLLLTLCILTGAVRGITSHDLYPFQRPLDGFSVEHITEVVNAPLESLSLHAVAKEPKYTMLRFEWQHQRGVEGTGFVRALRSRLTAHLPVLLLNLQRLVQDALAFELDTPQDNGLVHCTLFPMDKRTVTKINCFVFLGRALVGRPHSLCDPSRLRLETTTYAIEDVCLHDEYVQPLRQEICEHLVAPSPSGLAEMPLLDSFARESIRCTNSDAITVRRKSIRPFVFSDGLCLEQGDWHIPLRQVWGGQIYYPVSTVEEQVTAFHRFVADPDYDAKAALILNYAFSASTGPLLMNQFAYAAPDMDPLPFRQFTSIQPQRARAVQLSSLEDLSDRTGQLAPASLGQLVFAITFENTLDILTEVHSIWSASTSEISHIPGISWSLILVLIFPPHGLVLGISSATFNSSRDDAAVNAAAQRLSDSIIEAARRAGVYNAYVDYNHAAPWQDPIASYGEQNLEFIRETAARYDPGGIFQSLCPGGFKIN